MGVKTYKELLVWQKSMELVKIIYELVRELPKEELFALSAQMRRSAISLPSNIAEGAERDSTKEFIHFINIAQGSRAELETQTLLCESIGYLKREETDKTIELLSEIGRMLSDLKRALNSSHTHRTTI